MFTVKNTRNNFAIIRFLALIFLVCQSLIAQTPFRDLSIGNKYVYEFETAYSGQGSARTFYEEIIGDTILNGTKYAIIFSSESKDKRFERSSDSAIHVYYNDKEHIGHRWLRDVTDTRYFFPNDSIFWTPYGGRTTNLSLESFYTFMPVRTANRELSNTDTILKVTRILTAPPYPYEVSWYYQKPYGMTHRNGEYSNRIATTQRMALRGSLIQGKLQGDTAVARIYAEIGTVFSSHGQIVRVPISIRGSNVMIPKYPFVTMTIKLQYNADSLELQGRGERKKTGFDTLSIGYSWQYRDYKDTTDFVEFRLLKGKAGDKIKVIPVEVYGSQTFYRNNTSFVSVITHSDFNQGAVVVRDVATKISNEETLIKIFPTLMSQYLEIQLQLDEVGFVNYRIYDLQGQEVFSDKEFVTTKNYSRIIDIHNLSRGVYMIKVGIGQKMKVEKVVKLE